MRDDLRAQLITAAFFMEGLHDVKPGYNALLFSWSQGCIELVGILVSYVPFTIKLCDAAAKARDGAYPGVFDYEVSGPFGQWFGEYILEHGDAPPQAEAQAWLVKEVTAFFTQGLTEGDAAIVRAAVAHEFTLANQPHPMT